MSSSTYHAALMPAIDHMPTHEALELALHNAFEADTKITELEEQRARLMDGIGRLLAFTSHKPDCRFITTPADWTCDCGLSTAIMVVMNPHMDVAATITESEATDEG